MKIQLMLTEAERAQEGVRLAEAVAHEADRVLQVVLAKNAQYGDAWRKQGWMGNLGRILSKSARLDNMLWRDFPLEDGSEPVEETVRDLIALCIFFLLNRGQRNRWGTTESE